MKKEYIELLLKTKRPGIEDLICYLENKTDFFVAPASASHHGVKEGGLLEHSLTVYRNLLKLVEAFKIEYYENSLIISALLHDICKSNFYKMGYRNRKSEETGQWERVSVWEIKDQLPLGHGEKSVIILLSFIRLTEAEMLAIRWHMGGFDDCTNSFGGGKTISSAMQQHPLVTMLHMADLSACYIDKI